jgi:hypothetical protein
MASDKFLVMAGFVPAIHAPAVNAPAIHAIDAAEGVDRRDKPGDDDISNSRSAGSHANALDLTAAARGRA